jgi:uncharacterized protein YegL
MSRLAQNIQRPSRHRESGFTAYVIILLAATLAGLSMFAIDFGRGANRVSMEKQLLDSHGYVIGQQLIAQGVTSVCVNGEFVGDTEQISIALFNQLNQVERDERTYQCNELDGGEVIVREEGDPSGPPGTFRRYRITSSYNALQDPNDPNQQGNDKNRSVIVEIREISGEVERPRPNIMFVLDYSGSMSSNNRAQRLKGAMQEFVNANYEVDYGVILFETNVRTTIGLGSGANHDQSVMSTVNGNNPGGGTNFSGPLQSAVGALNQSNNQHSYVVLVSDGQPGDGASAQNFVNNEIRGIDPDICLSRNGAELCHTVYTLGVDGANMNMLESLSGNAATAPADYDSFAFSISAQDTQAAFRAIVDDILCSFGPLDPQPSVDEEESINVFLDESPLQRNVDFEYDRSLNAIKLYDANGNQACTNALDNGGSITIRYGKPRVIPE